MADGRKSYAGAGTSQSYSGRGNNIPVTYYHTSQSYSGRGNNILVTYPNTSRSYSGSRSWDSGAGHDNLADTTSPTSRSQRNHGATMADTSQGKHIFKTSLGLSIHVYSGDITRANVDAVTTGEGSVSSYKSLVTRRLLEELGHEFEVIREQLFTANTLPEGQAFVSMLPPLIGKTQKYRSIIHAFVPHYTSRKWLDLMKALYMNVCMEADKKILGSIAIPLLGAGAGHADTDDTIEAAAKGIYAFGTHREHANLKQVHIVTYEPSLVSDVCEMMQKQFSLDMNRGSNSQEQSDAADSVVMQKLMDGTRKLLNADSDKNQAEISIPDNHGAKSKPQLRNRGLVQTNGTFVRQKECGAANNTQQSMKSKDTKPFVSNIHVGNTNTSEHAATDQSRSSHYQNDHTERKVVVSAQVDNFRDKDAENESQAEVSEEEESEKFESDHICSICMDKMTDPKKLDKCQHVFCRHCIDTSFKMYKPVCPSCQTAYGEIRGNMPQNGTMKYRRMKFPGLSGYENYGTIIIDYHFPDGIQTCEHPKPGVPYHGTSRTAYLPDSPEGRKVLNLLQVAWKRRLTFTVGRSTTTGRDNVVTWNDIHHKTNTSGGESHFGYPDDTYLSRVTEELASKGVAEKDVDSFQ